MNRFAAVAKVLLAGVVVFGGCVADDGDPLNESVDEDSEGDDLTADGGDDLVVPTDEDAEPVSIHGTLVVTDGSKIVNQSLVTEIPSYTGSGWWFCGQAAVASAINLLRNVPIAKEGKLTQLEWFHQRLLATPIQGYPYTYAGHYEANIDALRIVTDAHPEFVVPAKEWTTVRATARDKMKSALDNGYLVVALGEITINNVKYGHYMAVYKIEHIPAEPTGGWVYYADPYTGLPKKQAFSTFLDGVGADGSFSFIKIKKQ